MNEVLKVLMVNKNGKYIVHIKYLYFKDLYTHTHFFFLLILVSPCPLINILPLRFFAFLISDCLL